MSHYRVIICQVDDKDGRLVTELANFDLPEAPMPAGIAGEPEAAGPTVGSQVLRRLSQLAAVLYQKGYEHEIEGATAG